MRKADIIVGQDYAYNRRTSRHYAHITARRVRVINRADVPDEVRRIDRRDYNANVYIVLLTDDGDVITQNGLWSESPYQYVSSRWIVSTWEVEVDRQERARASWERQQRAQEERKVRNAILAKKFVDEVSEFKAALESAGIPALSHGQVSRSVEYTGEATVTLNREQVKALTAALTGASVADAA